MLKTLTTLLGATALLALPAFTSNLAGVIDLADTGAAHAAGTKDNAKQDNKKDDNKKNNNKDNNKKNNNKDKNDRNNVKNDKRHDRKNAKNDRKVDQRANAKSGDAMGGDGGNGGNGGDGGAAVAKGGNGGKNISVIAGRDNDNNKVDQRANGGDAFAEANGGKGGNGGDGGDAKSGDATASNSTGDHYSDGQ